MRTEHKFQLKAATLVRGNRERQKIRIGNVFTKLEIITLTICNQQDF